MRKLVHGIGKYSPGDYKHPAFIVWTNMLERCYSGKKHSQYPSYVNCSVCDEWKTFSNFREWYTENFRIGYQLDKDILYIDNKIYSPTTCRYIPQAINSLFPCQGRIKGKLLKGVTKRRNGTYQAQIKMYGKMVKLGHFTTEIDAHNAYIHHRKRYIYSIASHHILYGNINLDIFESIMKRV